VTFTIDIDGEEDFVEVPLIPRPGPSAPQLIGIRMPEFAAPLPDRFVGDDDSTCKQQLFDVAVAEAEAIVQLDAMADDFGRETMMFVRIGWCRDVHRSSQDGLSV
jgi:hypothetical protein